MSVQYLARSLVSVGSVKVPSDEGEGLYVLSVRDGDLIEKYWVDDVVESENIIASGVRHNTSASYLLGSRDTPRIVIFIDEDNVVRSYAYNEDAEDWEETPHGDKLNIKTSPESKLSAIIGPEEEIVISYQDETGYLAVVMSTDNNEWASFGPLKATPVLGTPQCLEVIDGRLHLFYLEKGSGISYLVFDPFTLNWKANVLENAKFSTSIDNFRIEEDPETRVIQSYVLTDGSLWNVSGEKEKTCLGKVEGDGKLIPSSKAQAGWKVSWKGARKVIMGNEKQPDFINFNLETFQLPREFWHPTQIGDYESCAPERFGIDVSTLATRWHEWVVKLTFEKLGIEKHGNGFYVNIPNARYDVIFTAGHNLVDKPQHYCSNIRIIGDPHEKKEICVKPDMIRVCSKYFEDPDENMEIYDYGVILVERHHSKRHRGFGFHVMLGLAPESGEGSNYSEHESKDILQGRTVYVCGYAPEDSPHEKSPRRSEGECVGVNLHQVRYEADTKPGMSGGPVWLGFRGVETVIGIHTYGAAKEGLGNRGTRLNCNVWRNIFSWLQVGWYGKSLHYCMSPNFSMHLHLPQNNAAFSEGRVRVGKPGKVETLFDVIPVAAKPKGKESDAGYGFILRPPGLDAKGFWPPGLTSPWVRWDPSKNRVSHSQRFDMRCEVKIPRLALHPENPFEIQVQDGNCWKQVRMGMEYLDEVDLELLEEDSQRFEDTSEISFGPLTKKKLFQFK
ncbi:uncharacterized protein F4812DRAFT_470861 [Daldinia caldariorum]|uniref:uncharacterized protein n=1 Tax=Daldinia caldariorum TaxID=326644 RepID=UPI002007F115|nr:uncharacterized protein F4812DRAFT_470861 [Daldinia caldariorum]KAI1468233.1 hypothetical protein F4812DRAFT_470861 [Daldinia caldariorum]